MQSRYENARRRHSATTNRYSMSPRGERGRCSEEMQTEERICEEDDALDCMEKEYFTVATVSCCSNVPNRRHVFHFVGTNNRDRHEAGSVASFAVAKCVCEAIEPTEAAMKCFLSHSRACFEFSELVIVVHIRLSEFGILFVVVPTIGNSDFTNWNLVFEFATVHFVVRVGTGRKRPFQPHQFGFKKIKSQLIRKSCAVVFVRVVAGIDREGRVFWLGDFTVHAINTDDKIR